MSNVIVRFTAQKVVVEAKPAFDRNDVAGAFDTVLKERSSHSVNRLLRMFKLKNQNVFRKVHAAAHSTCQAELVRYNKWESNKWESDKFVTEFISNDGTIFLSIESQRQPHCAQKEKEEEEEEEERKQNFSGWIVVCCAILGTSVLTGYQLGVLTNLLS
jgi:hypothetical protein